MSKQDVLEVKVNQRNFNARDLEYAALRIMRLYRRHAKADEMIARVSRTVSYEEAMDVMSEYVHFVQV